jgi:hypothetical protein
VSRNEIIETLYRSAFIDDVIQNITSGHRLAADLKAELFLILCEMKDNKIVKAHEGNWINYLCINILKKQYHSSTSPFHNKWRKHSASNEMGDIASEPEPENNRDIIIKIEHIVDTKLDIVDRELFKIYYKMDRYDRWIGDLRDVRCEKITSSYRKMERKLSLKGEPKITISRSTISLSHQRSIMIIKKELERYGISI